MSTSKSPSQRRYPPELRERARDAAQLGQAGRDRRRQAAGGDLGRAASDHRAGEGEPGAAAGKRDPEERVSFLRGRARRPTSEMNCYIDQHRGEFGVEPICQVLEIAPSTYYEARSRPASARRLRDAQLKVEIERVRKQNFEVYGIEKVWRQLNREDIAVGRERVARLMREMGLEGVVRGKSKRTTIPDELAERPT